MATREHKNHRDGGGRGVNRLLRKSEVRKVNGEMKGGIMKDELWGKRENGKGIFYHGDAETRREEG